MSKTPPGVARVVAVLNFFAEHPDHSFTFTDIVKALDLGRATCHALLAGLVEAQYLYRNTDKSYVVGPALAAVGKIASENFSPMLAMRPELRSLSDEYRVVCAAVYREKANAVIRERAGSGSALSWSIGKDHSLPLRAPFAGSFFSVSKPYDIEKWLDELKPPALDDEKRDLATGIEFTRRYGFSFGVVNESFEFSEKSGQQAFVLGNSEYPVTIAPDLDRTTDYLLSFITSPVFNRAGEVECVLNLSGFSSNISGEKVEEIGNKLRDAAERVTQYINGRSKRYPFPDNAEL